MLRSLMMVFVLSLVGAVALGAPVRYEYVGVPIPEGSGNYTSFLPSGITRISGYFIVDNPLPASTDTRTVAYTSFMFTDGLVTVTESTVGYIIAGGDPFGFRVQTDANGSIVTWGIHVARDFLAATGSGSPANRHHFLQTAYEIGFGGADMTAYRFPLTAGNEQAVAIGYGSGSWSVSPVPLPPAVWLFGSALGLMGWMRRKAVA